MSNDKRHIRKEMRRAEIEKSTSYSIIKGIATIMDKYYIDPIIGLIPYGIGDTISCLCALPFLYVSLFKVRSIPLTLALVYNILADALVGMIPFAFGDVIDIFDRCYVKNMRLIVGFVENDHRTIRQVNKRALWMTIAIIILCILIYIGIRLLILLQSRITALF